MAKKSRAPWKRSNPRKQAGKASKHLSPANKAAAKARAKRAGRPYPNLVDNMRAASKKKKSSKKKTTKKKSAKKAKKRTGRKRSTAKKGRSRASNQARKKTRAAA